MKYLFGGKRVDNGEWVEGDLVHDAFDGTSKTIPIGIRYKWNGVYCYPVEVLPETVSLIGFPFEMPSDWEIKKFCYDKNKKPEFTKHWELVKQALEYFLGKKEGE